MATKAKTAKQEFLDKENKSNEEWIIEQILVQMTRTGIAKLGRSLKELSKIAYKSSAKEIPFEKMLECVEKAYKLAMSEKEANADV